MEKKLLREAAALLGCIAEVKSKCLLLKQRCKKERKSENSCDFIIEANLSVEKMRGELAKYSRRLRKIWSLLREMRNEVPGVVHDLGA
jgi:hypothetical protein